MKRHHWLWLLPSVWLVAIILFSADIEAQSADEMIRQQLEAEGIAITGVTVSPQEVFVTYEEDLLLEEDSQIVNWLLVMQAALETVPQAERVVIHMDILGEPQKEVTGTMANVRSLLSEEMDAETFVDRLIINDRRPPERALVEDMALLDIYYPELQVDGSELHIHFFQPEAESGDELMEGWLQTLLLVADKTGGLTRTHLHSTFPDGTIVDVSADMNAVLAHRSGELSPDELLDKLELTGLPEVVATPTPALGLIAPTSTPPQPGSAGAVVAGPGAAELGLDDPGASGPDLAEPESTANGLVPPLPTYAVPPPPEPPGVVAPTPGYDLYVRRMDFMPPAPVTGETIQMHVMLSTDIYPAGAPYFPTSHFRWRQGPDFPWQEESCPDDSHYATCVKEITFSYSQSGDYVVEVEADSRQSVAETEETNNLKTWTISVGQPQAPPPDPPTAPPQPPGPGRIAFSSDFEGDYEIYTMNSDGSGLARLTHTPGEDWHPAWSPDGSKIAYQCSGRSGFDLCVMNSDGSGAYRLGPLLNGQPASVQRPTWSPDGRHIAVSLESTTQPTGIEIVATDGSNSRFLTNGRDPSWSVVDQRITFMEGGQVFVINTDGSGKQQLTDGMGICMYPIWSPDGTQIAYSVEGEGIHVMSADGSNDRIVSPAGSWGLAWSPDGTHLALSQDGIIVLGGARDGSVRNLMQGVHPSWVR